MDSEKKTITIVDDEEVILDLLNSVLKRHGFNTILAANGREALDAIKNRIPDLVLLDIKMPLMDGHALSKALKEIDSTKSVGIIVITGYDSRENREKSIECGADDVIGKPLDLDELIFRIKTWLNLRDTKSETERIVKYAYMINKYLKRKGIRKG